MTFSVPFSWHILYIIFALYSKYLCTPGLWVLFSSICPEVPNSMSFTLPCYYGGSINHPGWLHFAITLCDLKSSDLVLRLAGQFFVTSICLAVSSVSLGEGGLFTSQEVYSKPPCPSQFLSSFPSTRELRSNMAHGKAWRFHGKLYWICRLCGFW